MATTTGFAVTIAWGCSARPGVANDRMLQEHFLSGSGALSSSTEADAERGTAMRHMRHLIPGILVALCVCASASAQAAADVAGSHRFYRVRDAMLYTETFGHVPGTG